MKAIRRISMSPGAIRQVGGALSVTLLAFVAYVLVIALLLSLRPLLQPWALNRGWYPEDFRVLFGAAVGISACLLGLLGLSLLAGRLEGVRLRLAFGIVRWRQLIVLFKNFAIHFVLLLLLSLAITLLGLQDRLKGPELQFDFSLWGALLPLLVVGLAVPIFEECLFRGYLYARLRRVWRFGAAFGLSGLLFSLLHFNPEGSPLFNLLAIANILMLTYFITKTFEDTGNLWLPIAFHALHNSRVVLFIWFFPDAAIVLI